MSDFPMPEESAQEEHELVLDDELFQEEEAAAASSGQIKRARRREARLDSPRADELARRRLPVHPGELVAGKYCVERVHQPGTFGVTVEAEHLQLGQRVALKIMLADPQLHAEAANRFLRGARFAVQLKNEHVARVMDVGTLESGAPYMVTEHLSGSDLRAVLRVRESLPVPEAVDYVLQACEALAEAHVLGFVHRNIKLSNLFLARRDDGSPIIKVLDFCVSDGALGDAAFNSVNSVAVSSLGYLSPEQIREPEAVDLRTDIWALGAVLYELISGAPLFHASTAPGLFATIAADAPTPLSHVRPDAPAELESVVLRCLEKDPANRFADVGDLARKLKSFASAEGRESVERIVLMLERRTRNSRTTRPPSLPAAESRAIVHIPPPPARAKDGNRRILEVALLAFGVIGCSIGIGAFIAVRSLQGVLAARQTQDRPVVASLSPALAASPTPIATVTAVAPVESAVVAPPKPAPAPAPAVKQTRHVVEEPHVVVLDSMPRAEADQPAVADAKPAPQKATHKPGLFDDAN